MLIPTSSAAHFTKWGVSELGLGFPFQSPRLISKGTVVPTMAAPNPNSTPSLPLPANSWTSIFTRLALRQLILEAATELVSNHPSTLSSASTYLNAWARLSSHSIYSVSTALPILLPTSLNFLPESSSHIGKCPKRGRIFRTASSPITPKSDLKRLQMLSQSPAGRALVNRPPNCGAWLSSTKTSATLFFFQETLPTTTWDQRTTSTA